MTLRRSARRALALAATTLALALGFGAGAHAFGGHGGPEAAGGPGARGDVFGLQLFEAMKARLNLNTSQQGLFDQAVAQGRAAREAARANALQLRDATRAELAKAEPDLSAVAALADEQQARNAALRKKVRDEWLRLYATFGAEQKAVVREFLTQKMNRAEGFRQKMIERWGERRG